jgi:hypothetical protein
MAAHQLPHPLRGVADVEHPADQRLDPAQGPPLVISEPVRQRAFPQLHLEPGPLLLAQLLPRHRPPGPQRLSTAVPPGLVPPPHRPFGDPQVVRDLADHLAAGEPVRGLQPQPFTPLLLSGRIPATLRIPHALVIRPQPPDVTTCALRINPGYLTGKNEFLCYDQALAAGWPIATGVIEGACRHLIGDRLDITGARWGLDGAEAILTLRAVISNGDFNDYWGYHLAQEHQRLYPARPKASHSE